MNPFLKAYYRSFQAVFNIGARFLPWHKAERIEGSDAISRIPELLRSSGVKKTLVVTDPGLMAAGVAPRVMEVLEHAELPYALYDQVEPNPTVDTVEKIRALYLSEGCSGLVAIGGGSAMDAAKGAAARIARPRRSVERMKGVLRVGKKLPPLLAVPTTSGTGSETTIAAVITDSRTHHKYAMMDLVLIPRWAVLDPDLVAGLPPQITGTTGMDALTHAVEAYLCWTYNTKESLRCAEDATVAIFRYLERAYRDGHDREAREKMMIASFEAGFAFTRAGVGNVHAIAHTLGGLYGMPHGLANAVILPIVLEDYGEKVYGKLARLAELTGLASDGTTAGKARAFIAEIYAMNARMHIPSRLTGIRTQDIPQMVTWALEEANPVYPVPVLYDASRCTRVIDTIRQKEA